jgi:Flp pilus assembly protein TadD
MKKPPMAMRAGSTSAARHEARENALRPCSVLGYDRDSLGMHLMAREAYRLAEIQFRRAVWLNPREPRFGFHLALCFRKQGKHREALELIRGLSNDGIQGSLREPIASLRDALEREISK